MRTLNRFTACVAFVFNTDFNSLRGVLDGDNKLYCTYLANQLLDYDAGDLSDYYRINKLYMMRSWTNVILSALVYDALEEKFETVKSMWNAVKERNEV